MLVLQLLNLFSTVTKFFDISTYLFMFCFMCHINLIYWLIWSQLFTNALQQNITQINPPHLILCYKWQMRHQIVIRWIKNITCWKANCTNCRNDFLFHRICRSFWKYWERKRERKPKSVKPRWDGKIPTAVHIFASPLWSKILSQTRI